VRQKGPDLVGARHSFGRHQNCKRFARTSLRSRSALDDALNAFGLFARAAGNQTKALSVRFATRHNI